MSEEEKVPETAADPPPPKVEEPTGETAEKPDSNGIVAKLEDLKVTEEKKEEPEKEEKTEKTKGADQKEETDEAVDDEADAELDDDEIEENPAYIPKKGRYYMHDSRDAETPSELEMKKSRADGAWSHDRYVERWQQPKSKKQLVQRYGFDIRHGETEEEGGGEEQKRIESPPRSEERLAQRGRGGRGQRGGRVVRERGPRVSNGDHGGSGDEDREEHSEENGERGGSRRERPVKTVRNVRGGRGQSFPSNGRSGYRNQDRGGRANGTIDRREEQGERENREDQPSRRGKEEHLENHRRGATRGAVRGFTSQQNGRQFVRTISSSRYDRGGRLSDSRNDEQHNRDMPTERRSSGGFPNRGRGGARGAVRGSPRGSGDTFRGGSAPKRHPMQPRQDIPPPQPMGPPRNYAPRQEVVFFDHPAPPPPPPAHQASPVVYFDPAAQSQNRQLPPREKKIIEIKSPN